MSELKSCPLCGGTAELHGRFDIKCSGCGCEINGLPGQVVDAWNRRAVDVEAVLEKVAVEIEKNRIDSEFAGMCGTEESNFNEAIARAAEIVRAAKGGG